MANPPFDPFAETQKRLQGIRESLPSNGFDPFLEVQRRQIDSGQAPTPIPTVNPPVSNAPLYEEPSEGGAFTYVGNLAELFNQAVINLAVDISDPNISRARMSRYWGYLGEAERKVTSFLTEDLVSALSQPSESLEKLGSGAISTIRSTGDMAAEIASHPIDSIGHLMRGMAEMFIEPILTAASESSIVGDEILDATPDEMSEGLLGAAALPLSAGVYSKLASGARGGLGSSVVNSLRSGQVGLMGRAIGQEYAAQAAAGLVQEGLMNPEDISAEMIMRNIANPVLLATSIPVGGLRYIKATRDNIQAWNSSLVQNADVMIAMPSAKQTAMTRWGSLDDGFRAIDALTVEDDWIGVALKKIRNKPDRTYILPGLGAEKADELMKAYSHSQTFIKPSADKLPKMPKAVMGKSAKSATLFFENPFDQWVATSGNAREIAAKFKISVPQAKEIQKAIADNIRTTVATNESGLKVKRVSDTPLPALDDKLQAFRGPNDTVMFTYATLNPEQIKQFTSTGFMVDEVANYGGKNVRIERFDEGIEDLTKPIKTPKGKVTFKVENFKDNYHSITAFDEAGNEVAWLNLTVKDGIGTPGIVNVEPAFERLGIGTKLYQIARQKLGVKSFSGKPISRSPAGKAFVKKLEAKGIYSGKTSLPKVQKVQIRPEGGKIKWVPISELERVPNGQNVIWNKRTYTDDIYQKFMYAANSNQNKGKSFEKILTEFAHKNGAKTALGVEAFEEFIYAKLIDESAGVSNPELARWITELESQTQTRRDFIQSRLDERGYKIQNVGPHYDIYDITGQRIGRFDRLEDLDRFVDSDMTAVNIDDLTVYSPAPIKANENYFAPKRTGFKAVDERIDKIKFQKDLAKKNSIVSEWFRRFDRLAEDVGGRIGDRAIGVAFADKADKAMNAIDAFTQGRASKLVKIYEGIAAKYKEIPVDRAGLVTQAIEQKSLNELATTMSAAEIADANLLYDTMVKGGGVEKVKKALMDARTMPETHGINKLKDPELANAAIFVDTAIKKGIIKDERILRYVDALDSSVDMTASDFMKFHRFNDTEKAMYQELLKFYDEGAQVFNIDNPISGYSPWIQRWEGVLDTYDRPLRDSEFVHEMKRIGITPEDAKIIDPRDLAYRYLKTGIRHRAPLPNGQTAGELVNEMNGIIRQIDEVDNTGALSTPLKNWMNNFKGAPTNVFEGADLAFSRVAEGITNKVKTQGKLDAVLDYVTLSKLGFRPILAVRDMVSSYAIASLYGMDAANAIFNFEAGRLKRIEGLSRIGELQQFNADALLSRAGRGRISKLTDMALDVSLQPQVYKVITGNMYIHTYDKIVNIMNKAKGNLDYVIAEAGDLLDSNTRGVQEHFFNLAKVSPLDAAKFLARRNAYNVANKFGRLNNPMGWQTKFGRAFGQFGSWNLNAITVIMESVANSRTKMSSVKKLSRLGGIGVATYAGLSAAGLNPLTWVLNPLTMMPGTGPVIGMMGEMKRGLELSMSPNQDHRNAAERSFSAIGRFLDFTVRKDLMKGAELMTETGDYYKGLLTAAGFKFVDED